MAVMVDGGSASSAEIVSGSLQQLHRAVLVGDTTFGKGLVQGFTRFPDGSGLRLTISRYYLAGGVYLNQFDTALNEVGSGLAPDYFYRSNERSIFPRTLENSLLLQQFANLHQDEIIAQSENFELADSWLDRFKAYARDNHFIFTSPETELAEFIVDLGHFESHSRETRLTTARILNIARKSDMDKFEEYSDYIK